MEPFKPIKARRSYRGPIGEKVLHFVNPLLTQRGFVEGRLLRDWDQIVGIQWSAFSCPEKILFPPQKREAGTLHIRVWGGVALEIQHQVLSILDRINGYFGYKAVAYLSLKQVPSPLMNQPVTPVSKVFCTASQKEYMERLVNLIPQEELKTALYHLGEALCIEANK